MTWFRRKKVGWILGAFGWELGWTALIDGGHTLVLYRPYGRMRKLVKIWMFGVPEYDPRK